VLQSSEDVPSKSVKRILQCFDDWILLGFFVRGLPVSRGRHWGWRPAPRRLWLSINIFRHDPADEQKTWAKTLQLV